jgi:hypothetical protein
MHDKAYLLEQAYRIGEALFEPYQEENPSVIRKFNKKMGL